VDEKRLREIADIRPGQDWNGTVAIFDAITELLAEIRRLQGMVDGLLEGDPMRWGGPCHLCHRMERHASDCIWILGGV